MQRLLLIYNPHSSNYVHVKDEVLLRASRIKGFMIGKFAIKKAPFEENVAALKEILQDGDIALAAGGDATAAVTMNAVIESGKNVTIGVLPYGNFNDLARTLGVMKYEDMEKYLLSAAEGSVAHGPANAKSNIRITNLYPLDMSIDSLHWRYAACYVTIGMTAESVEIFDKPNIRKALRKGHRSSWRSYVHLAVWYFKHRHKKVFMPEFTVNGKPTIKKASDYAAVNGRSMCRVMKGGKDFLKPRTFRSKTAKLTSFPRLFKLMATSILKRVPGTDTTGDMLEFKDKATVELQAEGEYKTFENIKTIHIEKLETPVKVIYKD